MKLPSRVKIVEMGARDGLQNEHVVSTQSKIQFINQLSNTGLSHIEAGSFVSPKWVPQMADSKEVLESVIRRPNVRYSALTPNLQGLEQAIEAGADEVAIFTSCSEGFCQKNTNCTLMESLERFIPVVEHASARDIPVRGYLSCVIDCPYDGPTPPDKVAEIATLLLDVGCYEVSLGDTIGTGTPVRVQQMLSSVQQVMPTQQIAVHFHDTWGQAIANIYQALQMGVSVIDSSVAGLGGCPYAQGASGNVATEDVLYLCNQLGIETGVNLEKVAQVGWDICAELNKSPTSKVSLALR
ncbi:hydroxymethylglutaryl-CoA lyase [Vibrio sp. ZSDE26]|uniref:hydroxymethylglutaryl-CoA lyase n=1 Tax=Vibrio amylolyticus TaxID=2847292 RepID=A0A9X1XI67_9VIBR|nr:hydroxymethylglutaryl-CoA lyase [Vibrio amylolyticus]